jgi:hypothetical protein
LLILKWGHHLGNLSIGRRIILKWMLRDYSLRVWTEFIWLRVVWTRAVIAQSIQRWATGWTSGVVGFDSRRGLGIFLSTTASRSALGPTQPPIEWVPAAPSLGVKRPVREADHSPPSSAEVKEWVELYLHSPNTFSWRDAQLSTGTTLPLLYQGRVNSLMNTVKLTEGLCSVELVITRDTSYGWKKGKSLRFNYEHWSETSFSERCPPYIPPILIQRAEVSGQRI